MPVLGGRVGIFLFFVFFIKKKEDGRRRWVGGGEEVGEEGIYMRGGSGGYMG